MYTMTREYEDFFGNVRKEDFRFNLTKAELLNLETSENGGIQGILLKIIQTQDVAKLMEFMRKFIDMSYGEVSNDGRKFIKSPEILENFKSTQAYSDIYTDLATNSEEATKFITGILPKDLSKDVNVNELPKEIKDKLPSTYNKQQ